MNSDVDVSAVTEAVNELRAGRLVVLLDRTGRGSGDVVGAAQIITEVAVNFMAKHARGLVSVALSPERVDKLRLRPMVTDWSGKESAATRCIEARDGVTTGISAAERAHTLR